MQVRITKDYIDYQKATSYQENKVADIYQGKSDEEIWLLEHPPLYTRGTSADESDLIQPDKLPVFKTGRGGQYTYHGPGQRIAYLMLDLKKHYSPPDLKKFVCDIEQSVIGTLKELGIESFRRSGRVGIWCFDKTNKEKKIAAIGIRVRKWVSFHGVSVNINPNLSDFEGIVPCGIHEYGVTSLKELGINISMREFDEIFLKNLKFGTSKAV